MATVKNPNLIKFSPSLCLTHNCNLHCVYCYQEHDANSRMSFGTACDCIDKIFDNIPVGMKDIEIGFIGGEPLLEFELIKDIVEYTCSKKRGAKFIFYATTNGTVLTTTMKEWFRAHRDIFVLALSLDGNRVSHNHNRSDSFDKIDFQFFLENYPEQSVKMTLSEFSIRHLADNVKFIHNLGFKYIGGVNLAEGDFDWSDEEYIKILTPQLKELVDFYVLHDDYPLNQMFDKKIDLCESTKKERRKWCGIGDGAIFFDVDGKIYPCPFVTPMTFSHEEISQMKKTDFMNPDNFIDEKCFNDCYIYPICSTCAAANYLNTKKFSKRDKSRCEIQKLIALFLADLQARRIIKNPDKYSPEVKFYTIEAIKKIRELYWAQFQNVF